jgi:hypothetical protein
MKKLILFTALMSLSFGAFNQTKEKVRMVNGVLLDYKIEKLITDETDTVVYFYWSFQNLEYPSIRDIGSFIFFQKEDLQLFVDKLKLIAKKEDGSTIDIAIKGGSFKLFDFAPNSIYITESSGKFTTIQKKEALDIALEIEQHINLLK